MKFIQKDHSVECIREHGNHDHSSEEIVASFDEQLDSIPPHVAGLLSTSEINELEHWLDEKHQLRASLDNKPLGNTILETLPSLMDEATQALASQDILDKELYKQIKKSLMKLDLRLSRFHKLSEAELSEFNALEQEEVLKEQLNSIQNKIKVE